MHAKLKEPKKFQTPAPNKYEVDKDINNQLFQPALLAGHYPWGAAILCFWCEALPLHVLRQAGDHQDWDSQADRRRVQTKERNLHQGQAYCAQVYCSYQAVTGGGLGR